MTCTCVCGGYGKTSEAGFCDDGIDNDCDGAIDCNDSDCLGDPACDPDTSCEVCANNSWYWDTDGGATCDGDYGNKDFEWEASASPRCCGDDTHEYYQTRQVASCSGNNCPSFSSDSNDDACCMAFGESECVYNGACYGSFAGRHTINGENLTCATRDWFDCDKSEALCEPSITCNYGSNAWVAGGESSAFGEYDTGTSTECCGDDANEYYVTQGAGSGACCNSSSDCVDSGNACRDEYPTEVTCNDGIDNDCDGATDCADSDCSGDPACCTPNGQSCSIDSECCSGSCVCGTCSGSCDYSPACTNTRCLNNKTYQTEGTSCCGYCNGVWTNAGTDSDLDTYDNQCETYDNDPCSVNSLLDNCGGTGCVEHSSSWYQHCAPSVPSLSVTAASPTQIDLSWNDVGATEYFIYAPESPTTEVNLPGSQLSYSDTGLTPNTIYIYYIAAKNAFGWSHWSNRHSGRTFVCIPDAVEEESCGLCGTKYRTCGDNGQWGEWGSCTGDKKADGQSCSLDSECCSNSCFCNICGGSCDYSPACTNTRCLNDKTYQTEGTSCCGGCNGVWTNVGIDSDLDTFDNECENYDNDPCSVNSLFDNCGNALGGCCAKVDQNYCDYGCAHCGDGVINCSEDCEEVVDCFDPGECKYITCVDCVCVSENDPDSTECGADSYDDWIHYCKGDEDWKHHLFHDFYCVSGSCADHTSWQDDQLVKDCSLSGNWDGDALECNCDCNGYDVQESPVNGNCNDGKDNDCNGLADEQDLNCEEVFSSAFLYSVDIPTQSLAHFALGKQLSWNDNQPANTDVKYQIEYYNGISWQLIPDTDLPGNSVGLDISPVNISCISMDYSQIRLRANLSTTDTFFSPSIQDWGVNYYYSKYILPEPSITIGSEEGK